MTAGELELVGRRISRCEGLLESSVTAPPIKGYTAAIQLDDGSVFLLSQTDFASIDEWPTDSVEIPFQSIDVPVDLSGMTITAVFRTSSRNFHGEQLWILLDGLYVLGLVNTQQGTKMHAEPILRRPSRAIKLQSEISLVLRSTSTASYSANQVTDAKDIRVEMDSRITFGAGCFWCLDAVARRIPGILSSTVGYAGGSGPEPTYESLHYRGGASGWVEGVQIEFDPEVISLKDVIDLFFQSHDPTTPNQDGANFGPEYHSTIYYKDHFQKTAAEEVIHDLQTRLSRPIVTTLKPFTTFVIGENEHQDFYNKHPRAGYCRVIIAPKLRKLGLDH